MDIIIALTGHRPKDLGGYNDSTNASALIMAKFRQTITKLADMGADITIISGMAQGVDQWCAREAVAMREEGLSLEVHGYLPYAARLQVNPWPEDSREAYYALVKTLDRVNILADVKEKSPSWSKMARLLQARNEAMVDASDMLLAFWLGSPGGTGNCVKYSLACDHPTLVWNPRERKFTWHNKDACTPLTELKG
jgi:uncharacterized phage-like protein YoqJ